MTQTFAEPIMTPAATEPMDPIGGPPQAASLVRRAIPMATTVGVSFAIVALQLAQGILLARLLGPLGRGEFATAVLYVQLLMYVGLFGGIEVVCRYAADKKVDRQSLRNSALRLSLITGVITTIAVVACNTIGLPADKRYIWPVALLCALSVVGQQMTMILSAVDRGAGNFARYNRIRLFAAAAFPALLFLWAMVSETTLLSCCLLLAVASLGSIVPCLFGTKEEQQMKPAPQPGELFREGRPYALSMLATESLERLDLVLMLWLTPILTQGFYNAMIPVAYPLTVIPNTLGLYLFNAGARQGGGLSVKRVHHILASSIALQLVMTIGFLVCVGPVVRFVYGDEFAPAVIFAMWLAPVAAIKGIVQGLESYVKGRGRPLATLWLRAISTVVMVITIAILYPITNVLSIVQGSLAGQVVCILGLAAIVYGEARYDQATRAN